MISLTRSLAQEYGPYGVRANIVLPGTVRTPLWEKRAAKDPRSWKRCGAGIRSGASSSLSMSREPWRFLASDAASAITGVALPVDCGLTSGNLVMRQRADA